MRVVRRFEDATQQHFLLVTRLADTFAQSFELGEPACCCPIKATPLHDVGKIHVPSAILRKPGKLADTEVAVVRLHPEHGYCMLTGECFGMDSLAAARFRYEMLDGSGYPHKLKAVDIPDLVRLGTVCDLYTALIERWPHKPRLSGGAGFTILDSMAGRLYPAIVRVFRPVAAAVTPRFLCDA